ncbi:MAG: hypothetical protein KDC35_08860 [Acidobacteria bacterium]|nr:hypothetical protein [Acidobacteriota bacterium]
MCRITIRIDDPEVKQTWTVEKELIILRSHHGDFFEIECDGISSTVYQLERAQAIADYVASQLSSWLGADEAEN